MNEHSEEIVHDANYYKMNDLIFAPGQALRESNAMSRLLLRYEGFSNDEIDNFKDKDGVIRMPDFNLRMRKERISTDFPSTEEIASLHALLPSVEKVKFNSVHL